MGNSLVLFGIGPIIMFLLSNLIFFIIVAVIVKRAVNPDKIIAELKMIKMQLRELQESVEKNKQNEM